MLSIKQSLLAVSWTGLVFSLKFFSIAFLPRCMQCRRGLAMRILSVRPSVKHVLCDKTEERSVQIFIS